MACCVIYKEFQGNVFLLWAWKVAKYLTSPLLHRHDTTSSVDLREEDLIYNLTVIISV